MAVLTALGLMLPVLKIEEGTLSQGLQVTLGDGKSKGLNLPLERKIALLMMPGV